MAQKIDAFSKEQITEIATEIYNDMKTVEGKIPDTSKFISTDDISAEIPASTAASDKKVASEKAVAVATEDIKSAIAALQGVEFKLVDQLPDTGEAKYIYLVPKSDGSSPTNLKDEYLWVGNHFELVGNTSIDLSGYVQFADINYMSDEDIAEIMKEAKGE